MSCGNFVLHVGGETVRIGIYHCTIVCNCNLTFAYHYVRVHTPNALSRTPRPAILALFATLAPHSALTTPSISARTWIHST